MARLEPEFTKRGVKLLGLSANTVGSHEGWAADIKEISGNTLNFPIVADKERKVAYAYDMYVGIGLKAYLPSRSSVCPL